MFLITDSESTHKVTSIVKILTSKSIFMEGWAPNPDFGQNPVFAVRDTWAPVPAETDPGFGLAMVESTPDYLESDIFFDRMCATPFIFFENAQMAKFIFF